MSGEHARRPRLLRLALLRRLSRRVADLIIRVKQAQPGRLGAIRVPLQSAGQLAYGLGWYCPNPFAYVVCRRPEPGAPVGEKWTPALLERNHDPMMATNPRIMELAKIEIRDPLSPLVADCYLWCLEDSTDPAGPKAAFRELGDGPRDRLQAYRVLKAWARFLKDQLADERAELAGPAREPDAADPHHAVDSSPAKTADAPTKGGEAGDANPEPGKLGWSGAKTIIEWTAVFPWDRNTMSKILNGKRVDGHSLRSKKVGGRFLIAIDDLPAKERPKHLPPEK